jgi:hypothetical protein
VQLSSVVLVVGVASALGGVSACAPGELDRSRAAALTGTPRHGVWVYNANSIVSTQAGRDALMDFVRAFDIDDVYLSIGAGLLTNSELPGFLHRLYGNGVRADALMGCPYAPYDEPSCRVSIRNNINAVKAYNLPYTDPDDDSRRFQGIHVDIEPWVDTGADRSWIEPLIELYDDASAWLEPSDMPLVADVSTIKMANLATSIWRTSLPPNNDSAWSTRCAASCS